MKTIRYEGERVVVFGATGFIGRWVARYLTAWDADLYLVVRDETAAESILAEYGIQGQIVKADLLNLQIVDPLLEEIRPSILFNLAGYGVDRRERDERTAYHINGDLLEAICRAMGKFGNQDWSGLNVVHVGTALEYGVIRGDLSESSEPQPTTLYGRSKLAGTQLLAKCCDSLSLKAITARLFTIYGPGEAAGRLVPTLLETARTKRPLAMTAGEQKRDFTYVEDVAEGLLRLGLTDREPAPIVNLATGKLTPVRDFVQIAARELDIADRLLEFGALPTRPEEMAHDPVNVKRLQKMLDWKPITTIPDGIRKTAAFAESRFGVPGFRD